MEWLLDSNVTDISAGGTDRRISPSAIITIVIFTIIACGIFFGAVCLLVKGKNISELFEDKIEDGDCDCIGFSNHSDEYFGDEVHFY